MGAPARKVPSATYDDLLRLPPNVVGEPGEDVVVPDLAGWRRDRLPHLPDEAFLTLAPQWVCEITSPSTQRVDRGAKTDIYLREGVDHVWLLDPIDRFVEIFRRGDAAWIRAGSWTSAASARLEPFEAIELDLHAICEG